MLERQKYEFFRSELKKARLTSGLLQKDLAKSLHRPQSYISKIESGERSINVVEFMNYCQAIGIDPAKFIKKISDKF
jgi:transcriptional regulator with XRE-family HTH domain